MATASAVSVPSVRRIGIECEAFGDGAGVARLVTKLLAQLVQRPELKSQYRFRLYFKSSVPKDPLLENPLFERVPVWCAGSFVLYYYVFLPLRLWLDRPSAMYYPNYMLPIIHPPFVPSLVMMTEDVFREARNPQLSLHHRLAYRVFSLGWARRFATRVMAISEPSKKSLSQEGIASERIIVNQLGVDAYRDVQPMPGSYLLFVGQAFARRHLKETLEAFESLALGDKLLRFVFIGTDKYLPPVIDGLIAGMNKRLGRPAVQHIARVSDDDLARFYAGARATVYVSDVEAFGLPPLEALAAGSVPVVLDTPVNREIYGANTCYSKGTSAAAIGDALASALRDETLRARIRAAAPAILAPLSWKAHTDRWLAAITQLSHHA